MELIGASWIIFIKYTSYILSKLEKLKYLENLPVFLKILLVGYCIHINSVKSANEIVPYLIFYSTPWFGQCVSSESKSRGMSRDYQVGLTFRSKAEVSSGTIRRDYHLKAIVEVWGGTIKWPYHLDIKAEVWGGTIRWDYLLGSKAKVSSGTIRRDCHLEAMVEVWGRTI